MINSRTSLISFGSERMLLYFSKANLLEKALQQPEKVRQVLDKLRTDGVLATAEAVLSKINEPLPLGYCNAGVVLEVGSVITDLQPGDRVASNGPHAEVVCVPRNLCAKIPEAVSDDEATFTVLGAIALQGVRLATPTMGERFVVFGLGLVGLLTVQFLRACGCPVLAVDVNADRLKLAEAFGASTANACGDTVSAVLSWSGGKGVDGAIIAASAKGDDIVHQAAQVCRKRGRIILVGVVDLNLRRSDFYEKEITFQVSCSYGPGRYDEQYEQGGQDYPFGFVRWTAQRNFEAVLEAMRTGQLRVKELITHRLSLEETPEVYGKVLCDPGALGVIIEYPENVDRSPTISIAGLKEKRDSPFFPYGKCAVALIGAGNFSKMTLAPALAKTSANLKYVSARTNGAAAMHIARKHNFAHATTDLDAILADEEVNTVFIATRHDSHPSLICRSLTAGKHVFVEKPLAIDVDGLKKIIDAIKIHPDRHLMVGFNRRFSAHAQKIKTLLVGRSEPLAMTMTVNAGSIPLDSWIHDPERGGGRIIGEACHFIDLMVHLTGCRVVSVAAIRMGGRISVSEDKMSIVLSFEDGSVGTINYFGNGNKAYPKEILEIYSEGRIIKLNNFRSISAYGFRGFRSFRTWRQDKGHGAEIEAFVERVISGGAPLIPFDQIVNVTRASFAAVESTKTNKMIHVLI